MARKTKGVRVLTVLFAFICNYWDSCCPAERDQRFLVGD